MPEKAKTFNATLKREKVTETKIRFKEVASDGPPVVGSLYLDKWRVKDAETVQLTLTIPAVE